MWTDEEEASGRDGEGWERGSRPRVDVLGGGRC